ncbi:hypothetical protein NCTGTJJY_CDS0047 [Serratia phage 92A1]|nr:hypothetical protein NCTGTJJY_CDS0047 [Serratia phage 92A1]
MKRIAVALALISMTGCAQMVELDQRIARSINPDTPVVSAQSVGKARQGLTAEAGGNLAYYHTYDRKPTKEELQYAQKSKADFNAMVKADKERVPEKAKVDPRATARTICDLVFESLKLEAYKRLERGDDSLYEALVQKGDRLYNECFDEQLQKAKND